MEDQKDIDPRWTLWQRNVRDEYKDFPTEEIKSKLKEKAFPFAALFENWQGDFNIATGVRNANAFGAKEVFYLGNRKWDRRGSVGTYKYTEVIHLSSIEELLLKKKEYIFIGIDNVPGAAMLTSIPFPKNSLFLFGEEGFGLTPEVQALCDKMVEIEMFGSVRSLNCGTASGIIMYDYIRQWAPSHK